MSKASGMSDSFPVSTRQALIQKAKSLQLTKGSYSTIGWSNRLGTTITPASIPGVFTADRPFYWNNIDVGCRMTIIQLETKDPNTGKPYLWIHSPVRLDGPLIQTIHKLGTVQHVISPNYEHVAFAYQWAKQYPTATMWACPGMMARHAEVNWTYEIPSGARPDYNYNYNYTWGDSIQAIHVDCEVNPFTGKPFFNEVIFFHLPSATLMTTDLFWNYPKSDGVTNSNYETVVGKQDDFGNWDLAPSVQNIPIGSNLWKLGMDKVFAPFYMNLMVQKQPKLQDIVKHILDEWNPTTLIPAHGDVIRGKTLIQNVLQKHFGTIQ